MVSNLDLDQDNGQDISPEMEALQTPEGELYLRFHLPSQEEFALPAIAIREVMQQSPDRITPIPNASPLLLGTLNLRGQVIWVADHIAPYVQGEWLGENTHQVLRLLDQVAILRSARWAT